MTNLKSRNTCQIDVLEGCDIVYTAIKDLGGAAKTGEIRKWVRNNYPSFDMSGKYPSEWHRCNYCMQELKIGTTSNVVKVKTLLTSTSQPDGKWRIAEETGYKWFKRYSSC
tara:strand:+ start:607 stop:939 length:333 start_codon:yes stop_codon:yes gene_type:complete